MVDLLKALPASQRSTLIVIGPDAEQDVVYRAAGNLDNVKIIRAGYVNVRDVLGHERLLLTTEAVETIHGLWATEEAN
jgi:ribosomal protein L4